MIQVTAARDVRSNWSKQQSVPIWVLVEIAEKIEIPISVVIGKSLRIGSAERERASENQSK